MSRGPGKIQKSILEALQEQDKSILRNKLQWKLSRKNGSVVITDELCGGVSKGYIEDSYVKAFQRSLKRLHETGKIIVRKRKLRNIDEFIEHYPFKTSSLEIFQLRCKLFPHVKSYLEGPYSDAPFTLRHNELYVLKKIKTEHPEQTRRYSVQWKKIEKKIIQRLPNGKHKIRNLWVKLVVKGQQLFLDDRVRYRLAFHTIIKRIEDAKEKLGPYESELFAEIQKFKRRVFNLQVMMHSRLKSQLYLIAYFNERTTPSLKQEIKEHFLDKEPGIVTALPDHHQPERKGGFGVPRFEPSFSPILDNLIDRYVFSSFEFLSI